MRHRYSVSSDTTGQLRTHAPLDYETKNAYTVTVSASDGKGGTLIASTLRINCHKRQ